jgi:hypothetical protein
MGKAHEKLGKKKSKRSFANETKYTDAYIEEQRQVKETWDPGFTSPEQYVKSKLKMLRKEMYIEPTGKEIAHLQTLKTRQAIDNAVHSIIDRHWDEE